MLEKDWKVMKDNQKYPFGGCHAQVEIMFV